MKRSTVVTLVIRVGTIGWATDRSGVFRGSMLRGSMLRGSMLRGSMLTELPDRGCISWGLNQLGAASVGDGNEIWACH
jgi:hypothetical protein